MHKVVSEYPEDLIHMILSGIDVYCFELFVLFQDLQRNSENNLGNLCKIQHV